MLWMLVKKRGNDVLHNQKLMHEQLNWIPKASSHQAQARHDKKKHTRMLPTRSPSFGIAI